MYEQTGLGLFIFDENRFVSFLSFGSLNNLNPHGKSCESEKLEFFLNYVIYFSCSSSRLNKLKYTVKYIALSGRIKRYKYGNLFSMTGMQFFKAKFI
jgi:hypothetical protein